jgi:hypothetical protein
MHPDFSDMPEKLRLRPLGVKLKKLEECPDCSDVRDVLLPERGWLFVNGYLRMDWDRSDRSRLETISQTKQRSRLRIARLGRMLSLGWYSRLIS